jgi:hypothetical protein
MEFSMVFFVAEQFGWGVNFPWNDFIVFGMAHLIIT